MFPVQEVVTHFNDPLQKKLIRKTGNNAFTSDSPSK